MNLIKFVRTLARDLEEQFLLVFANEKYAVKTAVLSRKYGDFFIKCNRFLIVE